MNAEQAWLATMGQLKMDMSKAAFDTWVKNCELTAYEDGKFTIAVSNPYARDWLRIQAFKHSHPCINRHYESPAGSGFHPESAGR